MYNRFTHKKIRAQLYMTLARETPNDGVLALRGLGATSLLLTKPATISTVLLNQRLDYIKPPITRKFLRVIIGDGLILAEGEEHKFLRKNIQPAFTPRHIKNLYPMMWKKARMMTDAIAEDIKHRADGDEVKKDAIPTGTVDMCYWAPRVSLDIIGQAGLGHDFNSLKDSDDQLSKDYGTIMEPSMEKMLWFFLNSRLSYHVVQMLPWRLNTLMRQRISSVQRISNELVLDKRNAIEEKGEDHFDVLSLLIKSNNFSDSQLKDQLLTFLAAG
jgi:cytochrome P450